MSLGLALRPLRLAPLRIAPRTCSLSTRYHCLVVNPNFHQPLPGHNLLSQLTGYVNNILGVSRYDTLDHQVSPSASSSTSTSGSLLRDLIEESIMYIKRTFQPSLIRRKRKHGFLARVRTKDGRKVLLRRRLKKRTNLCA